MLPDDATLVLIARRMAAAGAAVLRSAVTDAGVEKAPGDYQFDADRRSEAAMIAELRRHLPESVCAVLAEESGRTGPAATPLTCVIDPCDGSSNWSAGLSDNVGINIAFVDAAGRTRAGLVALPLSTGRGAGHWYAATAGGRAFDWRRRTLRVRDWDGRPRLLATGEPFRTPDRIPDWAAVLRASLAADGFDGIRRSGPAGLDLVRVAAGNYAGYIEFSVGGEWDWRAGALILERAGGVFFHGPGGAVIAGSQRAFERLVRAVRSVGDPFTILPPAPPAPPAREIA